MGNFPLNQKKRQDGEGHSRAVGSRPYRSDLLCIVRELLRAYEYDILLDVLNREDSDGERHRFRSVRALLRHAAARFNLSFEEAARILRSAVRRGALPRRVAKLYERTADHEPFSPQRLHELFWTARILLERGDFSNFVIRTAMLMEATRRQLVYLLIDLKATAPLVSPSQLAPALNQTLDTAGMYEQKGDWVNGSLFLKRCIEWGEQQLNDRVAKNAIANVRTCISNLKPLEELRNGFVHQCNGISRGDIENYWSSVGELESALTDLPRKTKELRNRLGKQEEASANVYTDLNQTVLDALDTGITSRQLPN